MEKYNKQTIIDYINGDDIEGYDIEELEDDKNFMMSVIGLTGDEKFYNLCGDNIKKDYEFVKYLIVTFKNKINFICDVADYYLDNAENELEETEIIIIMSKLTEGSKKQSIYKLLSETMFISKMVQIEMGKNELNDDYVSNEIGMGFVIIFDSYNSNKIILDFYATRLIDAIFKEYDIDLESMLHKQFKAAEDIDKFGVNNYMLSFISHYDSMLASYLSTNIGLMSNLKSRIRLIQKNWNKYNLNIERIKYNTILDKVHEYMEQIEGDFPFNETEILYYIGKKLGIADKIAKYDGLNENIYESLLEDLDDEYFMIDFERNPREYFYFKTLMKIVSSILFDDNYDTLVSPNEGKILKVNFNENN